MNRMSLARRTAVCLLPFALTACTMGPDYVRPDAPVTPQFKEVAGWTVVTGDTDPASGPWWTIYADPVLDDLLQRVERNNYSLAESAATYAQSRALVRGSRAGLLPSIGADASMRRSGQGTGSSRVDTTTGTTISTGTVSNSYDASLNLSWELDFWGRLRRGIEADTADAQARYADFVAARLSLQSTLAQDYFSLRILDARGRLLASTVEAYQRSLELTQNQLRAGIVSNADVAQAQTQLKSAEADVLALRYQRAQLEHAIAVLVGLPPAAFAIEPVDAAPSVPMMPVGVPSDLLLRRPDVASAERAVQAANAGIGVAKAAYFPSLTLSASGGYNSDSADGWFTKPNRYWSLGPSAALTLLDFGARRADVASAEAAYDAAVASYRQAVLESFQEVEDQLVALHLMAQETEVRQAALDAANESLRISNNRYKAGMIDYLDVVTAQTTALNAETALLSLAGDRLSGSVALIAAMGGGWRSDELADAPAVASTGGEGPSGP